MEKGKYYSSHFMNEETDAKWLRFLGPEIWTHVSSWVRYTIMDFYVSWTQPSSINILEHMRTDSMLNITKWNSTSVLFSGQEGNLTLLV